MIAGNLRRQSSTKYLMVALAGAALLALGAIGGAFATSASGSAGSSVSYQTLPASLTSDHQTAAGPR